MMKVPKVSVLMPVYNSEDYLREAIDSILNQTFTDFEFIIIDDSSSDHSREIVESYSDPRMRFYVNEQNMGVAATLNRGLELATGEYIARMDSDDISFPERFEKQVKFLDANLNIAVLGTSVVKFGEVMQPSPMIYCSNHKKAKAEMVFNSTLAHPTVMIRKSILDNNQLKYEEKYNGLEDFVLWWRISKLADVVSLPEVLLKYRIHSKQMTQSENRTNEFKNKYLQFLRERLNDIGVTQTLDLKPLYIYCNGLFKANIYQNEYEIFRDSLIAILNANERTGCCDSSSLKEVCGFAAIRFIDHMELRPRTKLSRKIECCKSGVIPNVLMLKILIHTVLRRK